MFDSGIEFIDKYIREKDIMRPKIKWNDEYIMMGDTVKTKEGYTFIVSDITKPNNVFDERDDFVKLEEIVEIVERYNR